MKLSTTAEVIRDLRGSIPESLRTLIAHRFIQAFLNSVPTILRSREKDTAIISEFNKECSLISGLPFVKHDVRLSDSDLATFCNRWMNLEKYRDLETGEWKPFSAEMNSVRYTMCKELEALAKGPEATYEGNELPETD